MKRILLYITATLLSFSAFAQKYGFTFPQISDDDGRTFGNEIWRGIGGIGQHKTRVRFSRLGAARGRVFKLGMSDPVRTAISAIDVEAEPARS